MSSSHDPSASLTATYNAPGKNQVFDARLPNPATTTTKEKTAYMTTLRTETAKLQDSINAFLTERMEEDKAANADAASASGRSKKVDEDKEEEMYGEEGEEGD